MMQPLQQISNCSKETIDTTPIFRMNAVNEHHFIQSVKEVSEQQAEYFERERNSGEEKLDRLLAANGLVRKEVAADGNCFFKVALLHVPSVRNENDLRQTLCEHIIDHAHEYITFFSNTDTNESFEEDIIWIHFRTEVEELKCNGKWTNCAADLLPLTLSNWSRETIKLQRKYKAKQAISLAKKKDLLSLCLQIPCHSCGISRFL